MVDFLEQKSWFSLEKFSKISKFNFFKILHSSTRQSHLLTKSFWFFDFRLSCLEILCPWDRHFFLKSLCKIYTTIIINFVYERYLHFLQMSVNDIEKFFNHYIHSYFYNKWVRQLIPSRRNFTRRINFSVIKKSRILYKKVEEISQLSENFIFHSFIPFT